MWKIGRSLAVGIVVLLTLVMSVPATAQDSSTAAGEGGVIVYIGTSSNPRSQGIYVSRLDENTGVLTDAQRAAEAKNANFLALHPSQTFLYACAELPDKASGVAGFSIDAATGKLTPINQQPSGGRGPCYVAVDKTGRNLLVANYGSGSIACLPIGTDGKLGEPSAVVQHEGGSRVVPKRQEGPHAHWVNVSPDNRFVMAVDLGLDKVMVYRFDPAKGTLSPNDPPAAALAPGAGPRHLAWHPGQSIAYVINELDNTITVFAYDARRGVLRALQTVPTLPEGFAGENTTAEVVVHPSGRFVYGSNRGHNSIAIFAADDAGRLTPRGHESTQGETPRNFAIDPSGQFLLAANQKTGTVVVFRIDQVSGDLTPTGSTINVPAPVCIRFLKPAT